MKNISLSPQFSFGIMIAVSVCAGALILHTIQMVNFQYVTMQTLVNQ
jgi:DNA-binding transcriptional regulator of glucitol operon